MNNDLILLINTILMNIWIVFFFMMDKRIKKLEKRIAKLFSADELIVCKQINNEGDINE